MYEYCTTDSQKPRLYNLGFSQDMLHSLPIFMTMSHGASLILAMLYWESDIFDSLKPNEAYIYEVNYAFLGSDNDLSFVRNQATVWTNAELLSIPYRSYINGIFIYSFI